MLSNRSRIPLLAILWVAAAATSAQEVVRTEPGQDERVVPNENVRLDYAQVLDVQPVYQTLHATRTEQQCEEVVVKPRGEHKEKASRWDRFLSSVKGMFGGDESDNQEPGEDRPNDQLTLNCRAVPVEREFRRPIAYDVDYLYKGTKYRSRMAEDPGKHVRIRVSVMPYSPGQGEETR